MTTVDDEATGRNFTGAIYGSLLASSVVVGTSPADGAPEPRDLTTVLVATGIVFWLTHVYADVFGTTHVFSRAGRATMRAAAIHEWPIAGAVLPPAAAVGIGALAGLSDSASAWLGLSVAVAGQTAWAAAAALSTGAARWRVAVAMAVNLVLGLVLVALKALIAHA